MVMSILSDVTASLNKEVSVIPCYVKAMMVVAKGLSNKLHGEWGKYMNQVTRLTDGIKYDNFLPNQGRLICIVGLGEKQYCHLK